MVPGCDMTISVVRVTGDRVRLGFTAPPEIAVHREEVYQRVQGEDFQSIADHDEEAA
jgi:carbon storage regulator